MPSSHLTFENPASLFDPSPFGFSHVSIVEPPTRLIYTAGQVAIDQKGQVPETFDEQVRMVFDSIKACLAEGGASLEDIVNLTVYVVDYETNSNAVQLVTEMLTLSSGKVHRPPTAVIPVPMLAVPQGKVEITAVAAVPTSTADQRL